MKITIFDLGKNISNESLAQEMKKYYKDTNKETDVIVYDSIDTEIKDCIGCWSCWWKTPGKCALNDDAYKLYKDYICLLYTSDAADDLLCVDLGGRRII
ncbi:hypothetical protein BN3590_03988 [Clostridium sp. C105KSO15]|nr:hypothetical protein BN3590_03988 [Clostridium sp. C105KSO15]